MRPQKSPNNSLFLYGLATSLVYAPCATHKIEAPIPQIIAPKQTVIQTKGTGISSSNTIINPEASKIAYEIALKNMDFLYPRLLTMNEENREVIPKTP